MDPENPDTTLLNQAPFIAGRIPLLHVIGGEDFILPTLLLTAPCLLLISDENTGRTLSKTIQTEDAFGLGRCLYFYAGRANPRSGGVAFAFNPESETGHTGSATPFDTGGLFHPHIRTNLNNPNRKKAFCNSVTVSLADWRKEFAKYLADNFSPLVSYWTGRPHTHDSVGRFQHPENDWRAWVYEIRFHESHNIEDLAASCISEQQWGLLEREMANISSSEVHRLESFIEKTLVLRGTPRYAQELEAWARRQVGL